MIELQYPAALAANEYFPLIDEEGHVIGQATRRYCHGGSMALHPVVHLHVLDREGRLYLQKRSMKKDIAPGLWDTAVGGHVDMGESLLDAVRREAREELGLQLAADADLRFLFQYIWQSSRERELVTAFSIVYDGEPQPDHDEVDEGRFWTFSELREHCGKGMFTQQFEEEESKRILALYTKKVAYYTLGCRLNFAETSTLAYRLEQLGFQKSRKEADLVVVNTCAVTEQATAKSRQQINKLIHDNPDAYVIVTGCYAQIEPQQLAERVKGIDVIVGTEFKGENITSLLGNLKKREQTLLYHTAYKDIHTFHGGCSADDRTRHFLKVQDGCDYFCTYCTIPMARGRSRSASIAELVTMAKDVVARGGKEIVLTGVNIGDFGKGTDECFFDLCRALDGVEGVERYRIGSIEPNLLTDDLIRWIATESRRFAPHFHIPLQAGSDEVLALMRRRYDTMLFRQKIELVRALMPDAFIGVDVMAGMRGETAELFQKSYDFLHSLPVSQLHPFTYSERTGTRALEIKPVIPGPERHERTARLVALSDQKLREFYQTQFGTTRRVLWEEPTHGNRKLMHGFTENYIRVEAPFDPQRVNVCEEVVLGDAIIETTQGPAIPIVNP